MITQQEEDWIWRCIQPADNKYTPEQSDGYNEGEVYGACVRMLESPHYIELKANMRTLEQYQKEVIISNELNYQQGIEAGKFLITESPEYQQMKKDAEKWELLIGRLNDWSKEYEDGPTDEIIASIFWEIEAGR